MMLRWRLFQIKLLLYPILYFIFARIYLKIRIVDYRYDFIPYTAPFLLAFGSLSISFILLVDLLWSYNARLRWQNILISTCYFIYYTVIFFRLVSKPPLDGRLLWYFSLQGLLIMIVLGCIIVRLLFAKEKISES